MNGRIGNVGEKTKLECPDCSSLLTHIGSGILRCGKCRKQFKIEVA